MRYSEHQNEIQTPKNYVELVYDEQVPKHFWRIAIVTVVLPSRDSETKRSDSDLLVRFNKTQEIFPSVVQVLTILLTTAATSASVF